MPISQRGGSVAGGARVPPECRPPHLTRLPLPPLPSSPHAPTPSLALQGDSEYESPCKPGFYDAGLWLGCQDCLDPSSSADRKDWRTLQFEGRAVAYVSNPDPNRCLVINAANPGAQSWWLGYEVRGGTPQMITRGDELGGLLHARAYLTHAHGAPRSSNSPKPPAVRR